MTTGLNFLIESKRALDARKSVNRSLFETSMNFLLEADPPEGEDPEAGEAAKSDADLEKMMPKAVAKTVNAFKGLQKVKGMPEDSRKVFSDIAKSLSKYTSDPDTPDAVQAFKTAEEFHAIVVMILDGLAAQAASYVKAGEDVGNVFNDYNKIRAKAFDSAQAKIDAQVAKLPFLQRMAEKFKSKNINDRLKELSPNYTAALEGIRNIVGAGSGPGQANVLFDIIKDPEFSAQRNVQGQVISTPPKDIPTAGSNQEGTTQFDDKQKKLIDKVGERVEDFKKLFQSNIDDGKISRDAGSIMMKVLNKFEGDPEKTYQNLSDLGPKGMNNLKVLMQQAEEKFETLDSELEGLEEESAAKSEDNERSANYWRKQSSDVYERVKDLRKAVDYRVKNKEITEKEGDILQVALDKIESFGGDSVKSAEWFVGLGQNAKILVTSQILNDAKEGWTELDTNLKSIKKSAPKLKIDFGVPLDELEDLVRDVIDAPASKSPKAVQDQFIQGLLDAGSDEDKYTTAFDKLEKLGGGDITNPKALKLMGLDSLASERESESGQEEEGSEAAGKSLSSILFNSDSSIKKKLEPGGDKIKSSLADLNAALANYTSNKGGKKNKAALIAAIKGTQDSLKGVKLEGTKSQENVIVERWQRLAGLI